MRKIKPADRCYICGNRVGSTGELDHFPLPREVGGTNTEPACRSCHDMKDRYTLHGGKGVNMHEALVAITGLWAKASTDERILLAKMTRLAAVASHREKVGA